MPPGAPGYDRANVNHTTNAPIAPRQMQRLNPRIALMALMSKGSVLFSLRTC
jgi:hypothetical protein